MSKISTGLETTTGVGNVGGGDDDEARNENADVGCSAAGTGADLGSDVIVELMKLNADVAAPGAGSTTPLVSATGVSGCLMKLNPDVAGFGEAFFSSEVMSAVELGVELRNPNPETAEVGGAATGESDDSLAVLVVVENESCDVGLSDIEFINPNPETEELGAPIDGIAADSSYPIKSIAGCA